MQVDLNIVVHAYIRLPVFFLPFLYQIFYFSVVHAPHYFLSPLYNVQAPIFFTCRIISISCLYHQIFCFSVTHTLRFSFFFSYNMQIFVFFMHYIYTSFIYALHLVSSLMYQLDFIHSCAAFLPLFLCIEQASFIYALHLPLFACISYNAWSFPDLSFSLTCIKTSTQFYVQEIKINEYKTPYWPIRSLFNLVHIT